MRTVRTAESSSVNPKHERRYRVGNRPAYERGLRAALSLASTMPSCGGDSNPTAPSPPPQIPRCAPRRLGGESICDVLPIAPATYHAHKARQADPTRLPARAVRDGQLKVEIRRVWTRPNQLWLADLTYVATWRGFVYVAFVVDAFARRIVGWRVTQTLRTDLVLDALEQALYDRPLGSAPALVHHSDRGVQLRFDPLHRTLGGGRDRALCRQPRRLV